MLRSRAALLKSVLDMGQEGTALQAELRQWIAEGLEASTPIATMVAAISRRCAEMGLAAARQRRDALASVLVRAFGNRTVAPALRALLDALIAEECESVQTALAGIQDEIAGGRSTRIT